MSEKRMDTPRCIIKQLAEADIKEAIPLFTSDIVRKYLGGTISATESEAKLKGWINDLEGLYFSIIRKEDNAFIGIFSISVYHNGKDREISYLLLPQFWGNGYALEVLTEMLTYCKNILKLPIVYAETQSKNGKSCALLKKSGFMLEDRVFRFDEEQSVFQYSFHGDAAG